MSTPTTTTPTKTSAYPVPVNELVPQVRQRAEELGRIPSQNQLMTEFRVGVSKARAVLTALRESGFTPGTTAAGGTAANEGGAGSGDSRRLHAVPDQHTATAAAPDTVEDSDTAAEQGPEIVDTATGGTDPQVSGHGAPVPTGADTPVDSPADGPAGAVADTGPVPVPVPPVPVPVPVPAPGQGRRWQVLSLVLLSLPAFVAIWGGWVGLGRMTGFGDVELLPGIVDGWVIDSAITLPIGVEAYAAFALRVWLSPGTSGGGLARRFAMWSAFGALALGMAGQIAYHLMSAAGITVAPWQITTLVACLPVAVLGSGAALAHLMHSSTHGRENH